MTMTELDTALNCGAVVVRSDEGQTLGWGPGGKVRNCARFHMFRGRDVLYAHLVVDASEGIVSPRICVVGL